MQIKITGENKNNGTTVLQTSTVSEFNPSEETWSIWKERLDIHFAEINCELENSKKAVLLKSIGSSPYKLLRSLCDPASPLDKSFDELCKILHEHYTPPTIVFHERKKFYNAHRQDTESVSDLYARI